LIRTARRIVAELAIDEVVEIAVALDPEAPVERLLDQRRRALEL
jgi:hypothetical protein